MEPEYEASELARLDGAPTLYLAEVCETDGATPTTDPDVVAEAVSMVFNLSMADARLAEPDGGLWLVPVSTEALVAGVYGDHIGPGFAPYRIRIEAP